MREKMLLFSFLFFGIGCLESGSQRYLEKEAEGFDLSAEKRENTENSEIQGLLDLQVVSVFSGEAHPRLPDPGSTRSGLSEIENESENNVTQTSNEIIFHTKFFLPLPGVGERRAQAQFFAWPEEFDGTRIQAASYSHRVLRNGKWLGNFRPRKVWHDDIHFRWFIPFFDIFQDSDFYSESDAHLDDLQVIVLDLLLGTGNTVTYLIKFQVIGPVPELIFRELDPPALPEARVLGNWVSTVGWVVKKEELTNPSRHSLQLWLRSPLLDRNALFLSTYLRSSRFTEQLYSPPTGMGLQPWVSRGGLEVDKVRIHHPIHSEGSETSRTEVLHLASEQWQGISIQPGETLVLEWLARTQVGVRDCSLPEAQHLTMSWTSPPVATGGAPVMGNGIHRLRSGLQDGFESLLVSSKLPTRYFQEVTNEWSITGAEIIGKWSRDLRVAYSFLSKEDVIRSFQGEPSSQEVGRGPQNSSTPPIQASWIRKVTMNLIETAIRGGEALVDPLQFSCQGVLR